MAIPLHVSRETRQFYSWEYCWSHFRHEQNYQVNQRYQSRFDATNPDRIPSTTPGAEPPGDAKDSGSARPHSTHLETSSTNRP